MMLKREYSDELAIIANQNVIEREYWLNQLSGELVKSCFPYDYRKEIADQAGMASLEFRFSGELFSKLNQLSTGNDLKLNMILVTGVMALLYKHTGNKDIVIGSPIYKQSIETEFINTILVLRNSLEANMTFKELLLEVRKTIGQANEHKNYPIEALVDRLDIPVAGDEFPLFDVAVLLESVHKKEYLHHVKPNIIFYFSRKDSSVDGVLKYNPGLYRQETVERIIRHFTYLLGAFLSDVHMPLGEADILSDEEKNEILVNFNDTDVEYPKDKTLHQLFEEQVEKRPDGAAVIGQGAGGREQGAVTYRKLNNKSAQLAHVLREKGVQPNTIVGIMVERSLEMMIGILGILKAGGAYLPIEPDYPQERIDFMLKDSNARVLVSELSKVSEVSGGIEVVKFSELSEELPTHLTHLTHPTQLCYVIYTSGTTGRPKGVMVDHGNVVAYLHAFFNEFEICSHHTVIQLASYAFDVFIEEVFPILLKGGKVVIPGADELMDIMVLSQLIRRHWVNFIDCTPLLLNEFNKVEGLGPFDIIISGGDVLKGEYVDNLLRTGKVYNTFGPTETTVCAAYYPYYMYSDKLESNISIPIGRPISNYKVYILDEHLKLQPIDVVGELCVSGVGVVRGYLNRPELTAETFVSVSYKSYRTYISKKIYRTGDLARWLPDGNIEFVGRKDTQVKIRGFRIELGEIENRLLKYDGITQSAVIPGTDEKGDKYIIAYVISDSKVDSNDLKDFLAKQLPDYMIPSFFVRLNRFPLTPNGKVNVKALPEPEVISVIEYVEPQNQVQERIQKIWQEVIGVERIGIYDNFFDIGGHSLRGIQVVNALHSEFDVKVPLAEIFRTPTIKGLAEYIENAEVDHYVSIELVEEKNYYVLSSAQKRLYILQQVELNTIAYNMPLFIPLEQVPDKEKLEKTFQQLIQRHESLRTSFHLVEEEPVQRIYDPGDIEFGIEDHGGTDVHHTMNCFIRPFDLSQAPLLRVGIIKRADSGFILMMDMHHIISDGISQDLFNKDFMWLYEGRKLPPLRIQYKDYAEWENSISRQKEKKKQEAYWLNEFKGKIPVLNLPTDYVRPEVLGFEGDLVTFRVDPTLTKKIQTIAIRLNATMMMVLLSVFKALLAKYSGDEEIVVGSIIVGRHHAELEDIIGFFVNMLALKTRPEKDKTFVDYLLEVKEKSLRAYENQDYQFEELVNKLDIRRQPGRHPLVDTVFVLQDAEDFQEEAAETRGSETEGVNPNIFGVSHFDLMLHATVINNASIFMALEYSTDLFKRSTIEEFSKFYLQVLEQVTENPEIILKNISVDLNLTVAEPSAVIRDDIEDWGI